MVVEEVDEVGGVVLGAYGWRLTVPTWQRDRKFGLKKSRADPMHRLDVFGFVFEFILLVW